MMKKTVNLFFSLSPQQQKSLQTWQKVSIISFMTTLTILLIINVRQGLQIIRTQKKKSELLSVERTVASASHLENHQMRIERLMRFLEKIAVYQEPVKIPSEIIHDISTSIPSDVALSHFQFQYNKSVSMQGQARSHESLSTFIKSLKDVPTLNAIKLESVHHNTDTAMIDFRLIAALK